MKTPYLLMTEEQRMGLSTNPQLVFANTKTQNFDVCPVAKQKFEELLAKASTINPNFADTPEQEKERVMSYMRNRQFMGL